MSLARPHWARDGHFRSDGRLSYGRMRTTAAAAANYTWSHDCPSDSNFYMKNHGSSSDFSRDLMLHRPKYDHVWRDVVPPSKKRKVSDFSRESSGRPYQQSLIRDNGLENNAAIWQHVPPLYANTYNGVPSVCNNRSATTSGTRPDDAGACTSTTSKRDRSKYEDDEEVVFMSRDEIERCSPSRKDGISLLHETHLRYSYCAFLQNLGVRLDLPQTTIGTAMVVCHRFFVRRSHASHDRFFIATAALFLVSKSEETPRPLNDVLRVSCETFHKQDFIVLSRMFPVDWFEQYRERITDAEQLILTTLNFELGVQHPYEALTSTLEKLGFSQSILVNLALSLVSEGLGSSLWLQFKPNQIAAGAAYLAAKFLNMNLASCHNVWHEFHTPPSVIRDVANQLMELF
ncbi:cyclin-T1-5-like [Salvia divinorum]|uniref:Cyclin-T1-5-like n=1 Tax=Salvia divinorum TaxID=28513 RepID=A0ABD1HZD1_SALDI